MVVPTLEEARSFELEALRRHVVKRRSNIAIFQKAIDDEEAEIRREEIMIALLEADNGGSDGPTD